MENKPIWIIVHHSGVASPGPQFDAINKYHEGKFDWISSLGYYVAYHKFIERDGTVKTARADTDGGPHTYGYNWNGLAVCLAGNFDVDQPTPEQVAALCGVIDGWIQLHGIPFDQVHPHRFFHPTSCYGKLLSDSWAQDTYVRYKMTYHDAALCAARAQLGP